jgi:hypothetical protein
MGSRSSFLRLRLFLSSHFVPHVPELLPYMPRSAEYGHQEIEHESVQQIENDEEK